MAAIKHGGLGPVDCRVWPRFTVDGRLESVAQLVAQSTLEDHPAQLRTRTNEVLRWFASKEPPLLLLPNGEYRLAVHATRRLEVRDYKDSKNPQVYVTQSPVLC